MKHTLALALGAALAIGCGEDGTGNPVDQAPADQAPPTVTLLEPAEYAGLKGLVQLKLDASDDQAIAKVEVFLGTSAEPATTKTEGPFDVLNWGTSKAPDGLTTLKVRVTDTAGKTAETEPRHVILFNKGQLADLGGEEGEMEIAANWNPTTGGEIDKAHHWINPEGIQTIMAVLEWTTAQGEKPWELGLSVGQGNCPHDGQQIGEEVPSNTGLVFLKVNPSEDQIAAVGHFAHIRPLDAPNHKGKSQPYKIRVYLFEPKL